MSTVEHLLSAAAGHGIDNLHGDLSAPGVPIMEGSAGPVVFVIQSAGIVEQEALNSYIPTRKLLHVKESEFWVKFEPYDDVKVSCKSDFDYPVFKERSQRAEINFLTTSFVNVSIC